MANLTTMKQEKLNELYAEHAEAGSSRDVLGFWVYILSDCLLFGSFFATFAVLGSNVFGGVSGAEIFSLPLALGETLILLTSSFTCGLAMLFVHRKDKRRALAWFVLTALLGVLFLGLEVSEFVGLISEGYGPTQSGFLSSFFGLVGLHGLHVTAGVLWMVVLMVQLSRRNLDRVLTRKLLCLSIFWHFLDVVWILIFTFVYLMAMV